MATTIEAIHQEIMELKKDMSFIKAVLSEKLELSDSKAKTTINSEQETTGR